MQSANVLLNTKNQQDTKPKFTLEINVGDKEIVFNQQHIFEITFTEIHDNGRHLAEADGIVFTRNPPAGDSMSGYLTYTANGRSYEALTRKQCLLKAPTWLLKVPYYRFCDEHKVFYRTDNGLKQCLKCYSKKKEPAPFATNWD